MGVIATKNGEDKRFFNLLESIHNNLKRILKWK